MIDFRCPLKIEEVSIQPGDIVFGDLDGVCIIPQSIEKEVFTRAFEKAHGEREVYQAIKAGMLAQEAWDKFGIF